MTVKSYSDVSVCPRGHAFTATRRCTSAGRVVPTFCKDCGQNYHILAGPATENNKRESREEKECTKCRIVKKITEFRVTSKRRGTLTSSCRSCLASIRKDWAQKNPDRILILARDWAKKNPEARKEIVTKSFLKHQVKRKASSLAASRKQVAELSDSYIAGRLRVPVAIIPDEVIKLKRVQIQITRHLNGLK